jgi:hypothetical protein
MLFNKKIDVGHNMPAGDVPWQQIRIMRKNKTRLLHVVTDRFRKLVFGSKHIMQLMQCFMRIQRQGYFTVLIFIS